MCPTARSRPNALRSIIGLNLIVAIALAIPEHAHAQGKDRLTECIDRGLAFLATQQDKDGSFQAAKIKHPAVTSLAVLAYLSAGHVPGEGPHRKQIEPAVRWVLAQQQPTGLFHATGWEEMYQHAICTMMLCEVAAMSDEKMANEIRPKLEKAVSLILQAQRTEKGTHFGGWRYRLDSTDADLSVTGWQIMALRAARNIGCDVPAERIESAMKFVASCREPRSGGFGYLPGANPSIACTGTGILATELCGKQRHQARESLQAGSYLLKNPIQPQEPHFNYSVWYASQAMFQLGKNYWTVFRPHLHRLLVDTQRPNGAWLTNDGLGASYSTAMSILALTVEYRLLPLYQRNEDDMPEVR